MLLRGNNRREIEPADLYLLPLENEGPTKCKVLVILLCNGKTNQHGQHVLSIEKLKSKESNYKAYYKDWKWLIGQSGFAIHPETRCVTAAPEAWDELLRHRKSCKWHRYNALEFTELLDELYAPSMATGGYATTLINRPSDSPLLDPLLRAPSSSGSSSTPSPYSASGPLRKRRRINNDKLEKEEEKEILQGGSYQLIEKVITQLARSRRNVLQQAIDLLEEEYSRKLSSEHMDMALDCLENESKSSMFTSIKDVARRDRWLERHAGVEILSE
ncbi:hypothetical protein LIPSTDRAFT_224306 [Lipomyces starkeyi NRRL Y-11557]|uniref:Myb/SANT-like domain-containing protein n=1 Tax=Lipomyces starkeyi NRRL Y-11557 TaxID=675824 RepID=A0A1E3QEA1_LIPST|nr:hypothetical protein LIPSTDRAFT_224306 [Lipomyces starkeyi NRRL Y-11557]